MVNVNCPKILREFVDYYQSVRHIRAGGSEPGPEGPQALLFARSRSWARTNSATAGGGAKFRFHDPLRLI